MDLVNLMYKYINRFINSDELLEELKKLELNHYSKEEEQEIKQLILDVQNIKNTTPNEVDDIERKRLGNIEHFLGLIEQAENTDLNDDLKKLVQKKKAQFLKDQNKVYGYTDTMKLVNVDASKETIGKIIDVKITDAKSFSLDGQEIKKESVH